VKEEVIYKNVPTFLKVKIEEIGFEMDSKHILEKKLEKAKRNINFCIETRKKYILFPKMID